MNKIKENWKLETINKLRRYKLKKRILTLIEIIYHTGTPVILTYTMIKYNQPILFPLIIIIFFVRLKTK